MWAIDTIPVRKRGWPIAGSTCLIRERECVYASCAREAILCTWAGKRMCTCIMCQGSHIMYMGGKENVYMHYVPEKPHYVHGRERECVHASCAGHIMYMGGKENVYMHHLPGKPYYVHGQERECVHASCACHIMYMGGKENVYMHHVQATLCTWAGKRMCTCIMFQGSHIMYMGGKENVYMHYVPEKPHYVHGRERECVHASCAREAILCTWAGKRMCTCIMCRPHYVHGRERECVHASCVREAILCTWAGKRMCTCIMCQISHIMYMGGKENVYMHHVSGKPHMYMGGKENVYMHHVQATLCTWAGKRMCTCIMRQGSHIKYMGGKENVYMHHVQATVCTWVGKRVCTRIMCQGSHTQVGERKNEYIHLVAGKPEYVHQLGVKMRTWFVPGKSY